jgi:hypothetical protein
MIELTIVRFDNHTATDGGHEGNALRHSAHVGHSVKIAMIEAHAENETTGSNEDERSH